MNATAYHAQPRETGYDVVIIGGAMMGAAAAWFLSEDPSFDGSILVVERDSSYENSSTAHSNSCMRQQFGTGLNVQISQFAAEFVKNLRANLGGDARIPNIEIQNFGYLYLAADEQAADNLRRAQAIQSAAGAGTRLLSQEDLAQTFPFFALDDILLGSHNTQDEGYWDSGAVFDWWRRCARQNGVEFVQNEVTGIERAPSGGNVIAVHLSSGEVISCGWVVNASGPRAARTAGMAGLEVPIEPRKRFTWVFEAERPLSQQLPLTIDPSGVHVRQDGPMTYMAGAAPDPDPAVDPGDFTMDSEVWLDRVWPTIATRIPQFDSLRIVAEWAGHYAYNVVDQNAVIGPHPELENFIFMNGFSGHGLQQSPAMGRGIAEWISHGAYRSLDLSPFHFDRLVSGAHFREDAVI